MAAIFVTKKWQKCLAELPDFRSFTATSFILQMERKKIAFNYSCYNYEISNDTLRFVERKILNKSFVDDK